MSDILPAGWEFLPPVSGPIDVRGYACRDVLGGFVVTSPTTGKHFMLSWFDLQALAVAAGVDLADPPEGAPANTLPGVPGTPEGGEYAAKERSPVGPEGRVAGAWHGRETAG